MNWNEFLEDPKIMDMIKNAQEQTQPESSLNIFMLTSDYYYRENYHSDIIKEFLAPKGNHGEGNLYLTLFIQMLKKHGAKIDETQYGIDSEVTRETHKIDILIKGDKRDLDGKYHFIIIENKINDAVDMYRQIPRYVERIEKEVGGIVDAVVYIPKNPYKSVDKTGWTDYEIKRIDDILHLIPAHHADIINLVSNWIVPCINASKHLDSISILRQYASLIKSLTPQIMTDNNLQKFVEYINSPDNQTNIETVINLRNMIDRIPAQVAKELRYNFSNLNKVDDESNELKYFSKIYEWESNSCVLDVLDFIHPSLQIFIYTELSMNNAYTLSIRDWKNEGQNFEWLGKLLNEFKQVNNKKGESVCSRTFSFYQKDDIIQCVKDILNAIPK